MRVVCDNVDLHTAVPVPVLEGVHGLDGLVSVKKLVSIVEKSLSVCICF